MFQNAITAVTVIEMKNSEQYAWSLQMLSSSPLFLSLSPMRTHTHTPATILPPQTPRSIGSSFLLHLQNQGSGLADSQGVFPSLKQLYSAFCSSHVLLSEGGSLHLCDLTSLSYWLVFGEYFMKKNLGHSELHYSL